MWISKCRVTGKARLSLSWSKKGKHAWTAQIDKILALYARGMTTRDIPTTCATSSERRGGKSPVFTTR